MTDAPPQIVDTASHTADPGGNTRPPLSILIVAYNSRQYIADCIGSVIQHTAPGSYEILLVDNGTDGTEALIREAFPAVRVIPSQGNIGFGKGNNLLAGHARGDYLLLLNPDTQLVDSAIDRLLAFAQTQPGDAWGGVTTYPDGELDGGNFLTIPSVGAILREAFGLPGDQPDRAELENLQAPKQVSVLCGGFMMISRRAWDMLDGFDPTFLLYAEEIDLFTRMQQAGLNVWLSPDSRIVHDVGSGAIYSAARTRYKFTGLMHYARRHWPGVGALVVGLAYWLTAFRRWGTSAALGLVSGKHRARRAAYGPIVMQPGQWWNGYRGRTSLD
ncbi:glycosyltransferase family 2 protein [Porphyrobacter sp. YT40]|uniref:glycosyltransferase family 2 protein n=1 Tax=Porphyrobacter sp. YT40 TaxID=2547601 RepID=UPI0015E88F60|nr:glycosyltransferase family 2 protein [Porphyrobacter sp. YT40]